MNQKRKIYLIVILVIIVGGLIFIGQYEENLKKSSESPKFTKEIKEEKEFCSITSNQGSSHALDNNIIFCDSKGRMWTETATSGFAWKEALNYCEDLNYAGYSDWSLPGCESDESCILYEFGKEACSWTDEKSEQSECAPSWDKNANKSTAKGPYAYWSSTEMKNTEKAGRVDFYNGNLLSATKDHIFSVRCIRK